MTRAFNDRLDCPYCGKTSTVETAFGRWVREHPELESHDGYTTCDHDLRWHKFRTELGRNFQLMMNIEIKSFGAYPTKSQLDTMHIENQLLRNRRQTPTKEMVWQAGTAPLQVYSRMNRCRVWVRHFGVHLLRFSHQGPDDSEWIKWDKKQINAETLLGLLKFDLDPDTLRAMDWRSHHQKKPMKWIMTKLFDDHRFVDLPLPWET